MFLVNKKDSGIILCISYHHINKVTIKNNHMLPRANDLLEKLKAVKTFSNIRSKYHQNRVKNFDSPKDAFRT